MDVMPTVPDTDNDDVDSGVASITHSSVSTDENEAIPAASSGSLHPETINETEPTPPFRDPERESISSASSSEIAVQ